MLILKYPSQKKKILERFSPVIFHQSDVEKRAAEIIAAVQKRGAKAVIEFTRRFDGARLTPATLRVPANDLKKSWDGMSAETRAAIEFAADRIEKFHLKQRPQSYFISEKNGIRLEYRQTAISSAGLYVPGGTAAYPSSLLMNAIPAKIAGVERLAIITPPGKMGIVNPVILGAAHFLGIKEVYRIGGAQGVAALALGAAGIQCVDKIVGPGNAYVAAAKRLLYGLIDIDMVAGPSEILIIADETTPLPYIVADLLSQAEHDALAVPILIYIGRLNEKAFKAELKRQIEASLRSDFIRQAIEGQGTAVIVQTREQAAELANLKAPEHLEVMTEEAEKFVPLLKNAGAIFLGLFTPEPIGDYVAGPNHVLPTGGTARFFSPLSVTDFMKGTSILQISQKGLRQLGAAAIHLAEVEGLDAHAQAIKLRL